MPIPNTQTLKPKICLRCGKQFQPNTPRRMYCSDTCKRGTSNCKVCGKSFVMHGNTTGRYCSRECWYKSGDAKLYTGVECPVCHKVFSAKSPDQKFCSTSCAGKGKRKQDYPKQCSNCGKEIPFNYYGKVYCSDDCRRDGIRSHYDWRKTAKPSGAKRQDKQGYVSVKIGRQWRREHHVVMEQKLGRPLEKNERVHHINGIRNDNRPENLELWQDAHPPGVRKLDAIKDAIEKLLPNEKEELLQWLRQLSLA